MKDRIFMDVPHVLQIADALVDLHDRQSEMIRQYNMAAKAMVDDMEGRSKQSLEIASHNIDLETRDAMNRLMGHSIIYNLTGKNRIILDKEAAEAALPEAMGTICKGKKK